VSAGHRPDCPLIDGDECTLGSLRSPASFCRAMGWQVGTVIAGDEGYGEERMLITAIGERAILARHADKRDGAEVPLTLECRCWTAMLTKSGAL
jgi:hypothetical protein